jgi:hypothetical protein
VSDIPHLTGCQRTLVLAPVAHATHMGLAHRDGELTLPTSIQLAEAGVAVALRIALNVFVPEKRQSDVLALELAMNARPVWLDLTTGDLRGA